MRERVLAATLTTFVGRDEELAAVQDLMKRSRLVTLTGPGGSGKTRVALEVASRLEPEFRDGAVVVELAPIRDPAVIPQAITHALGMGDVTGASTDDVVLAAVEETELLLVLDNCEHLVASCAGLVERLLTSSATLRVLATSREALDIPGEVTFAVPPLSLPPPGVGIGEDPLAFDAVRLFAERAADAQPGFSIGPTNAAVAAAICEQLDGLPLAIELAAARMRSMSAADLLEGLGERFELLKRAPRTAERRHHTLRSAIDWSYDLLGASERRLFARLSVFAGGWSLSDAQAVCAGAALMAEQVPALHASLVDRSLVVIARDSDGPGRYRLLETLRAYAAERLGEQDDVDALRQRHFERFLAIAETYYEARLAGGSDSGLASLARDRDNFRAALAWAIDAEPDGALRLATALEDLWRMMSAGEGWAWLQRTLAATAANNPWRLRALLSGGMLAAYIPAYAEGAGLLRQVAATARETQDVTAEAWAELWLGRIAFFADDAQVAEERLRRAAHLHEELGNVVGLVRSLSLLGLLEALALRRHEHGEEHLARAAELARHADDTFGEGYAHMMSALSAADRDDAIEAAAQCALALPAEPLGPLLAIPLQVMAAVGVERDPVRAMRLLGAAAVHLQRTGTVAPPFLVERSDATRARAEELIGVEAAHRFWTDGRRMALAEAIAEACADATSVTESTAALTPREEVVAALVAQGKTNREVAVTLHISVRTVESHVDHILTKLGLRNRTMLSAWARAHLAATRRS